VDIGFQGIMRLDPIGYNEELDQGDAPGAVIGERGEEGGGSRGELTMEKDLLVMERDEAPNTVYETIPYTRLKVVTESKVIRVSSSKGIFGGDIRTISVTFAENEDNSDISEFYHIDFTDSNSDNTTSQEREQFLEKLQEGSVFEEGSVIVEGIVVRDSLY
jgi:hypothetical protein